MPPMYQKYLRSFQYVLCLVGVLIGHHVLASLQAGDIAFVQYNADGDDNFAFVVLVDMAKNEQLFFTDKGWQADNTWRGSEGLISWTAESEIKAGTVISITDVNASIGAVSGFGLKFSTLGDQLIAYQGTDTMIAGLNNEGAAIWQAEAVDTNTSALPQGLINGEQAVALTEKDNVYYTGVTIGEKTTLLAALNNKDNWTGNNTNTVNFSSSFIITTGKTYAEPSHHPSNLTATAVAHTNSKITLHWIDALAGDQAPFSYLILCNTTGVFTDPVDGVALIDDNDCGDTQGHISVLHDAGGTYTWTGLQANTAYFFKLFPYTNIEEKIDYKTDETPVISTAITYNGALVINEIYADPDNVSGDSNADGVINSSDDEFIELVNNTGQAVDISGWTLSDSVGIKHHFPTGTVINDQCGVVVFAGGEIAGQFGDMTIQTASLKELGLNNNGDTITLQNGNTTIDQVIYNSIAADNQSLSRDPDITGGFVKHSEIIGSGVSLFSTGTQHNGVKFSGCQPAGMTVTETGGTTVVSESETSDHFNVVLDKRPNTNIELSIISDFSNRTTVNPTLLVFTPDDWHTAQQITITGVDDGAVDTGDHVIPITVAVVKNNSDEMYHSVTDNIIQVTVLDNDITATPTSVPPPTIPQPNTPTNLEISITDDKELLLTWIDHSGIEQGYHLYRDGVLFETLPTQIGSHKTVAYHDITVDLSCGLDAIEYEYHVGAFNAIGEAKTENVSIIVEACPPPPVINTGVISFSHTEFNINENTKDKLVTLQLERIGGSDNIITVDLQTLDHTAQVGKDYGILSSTKLKWDEGDIQPKIVTVAIIDDNDVEENESFSIVLSGEYIDTKKHTVSVVIINDDSVPLLIEPISIVPPSLPSNTPPLLVKNTPMILNNSCSISGKKFTGICDHGHQALITNLQLMPYSSISHVIIPTGITVQGDNQKTSTVSNLVIEQGGNINSVQLSGDVIVRGQAYNTIFVGHVLEGEEQGTLSGYFQHNSPIGGSVRNIRLAHEAVIDGREGHNPKVGGLIIGHSSGTSRLENVIIEEGASVLCVQLGEKVKRAKNMVYVACDTFQSLKNMSADNNGIFLQNNADFSGKTLLIPQYDTFTLTHVSSRFRVDPAHIGQQADIFVYADYTEMGITKHYMLTDKGVEIWDGDLDTLHAFKAKEILTYFYHLDIFKGVLRAGILTIYIGYRLENGIFIYAKYPITS